MFLFLICKSTRTKTIALLVADQTSLTCTAYGLPKSINSSDVDVLFPTNCDLDDMHAVELAVPLPGEQSQCATFIAFVKLHLILQQATQLLFTTTDRGDCETKISRLEQQLCVWRYENPSSPQHRDYSADFLDLTNHFVMLLIHQPGLTLDDDCEQFDRSMVVSLESAISILQVLSRAKHDRRLLYLQPNATRMASQSALMCLYYAWHKKTTDLAFSSGSAIETLSLESAIGIACSLINLHRSDLDPIGVTSELTKCATARHDIDHALATIRNMTEQTYSSLGQTYSARAEPLLDLGMDSSNQDTTDSWLGGSSLWDLNAASLEEWSEGLQFETIDSYLPDFGLE